METGAETRQQKRREALASRLFSAAIGLLYHLPGDFATANWNDQDHPD